MSNKSDRIIQPDLPVLFFDFDDTLSEQTVFNLHYVRAIGQILAARFGGEEARWAQSAIDMFVTLETQYIERFQEVPTGYNAWFSTMHTQAMHLLFSSMSMAVPSDADRLSKTTQERALAECDATFPDTLHVIASLYTAGYTLHMASGNDSEHLRCALKGAKLAPYFDRLYGPDLIDCAKEGRDFYARIFQSLNIAPNRAIIIDNDPNAIAWAISVGAQAIQVDFLRNKQVLTSPGVLANIKDLTTLPLLIHQI